MRNPAFFILTASLSLLTPSPLLAWNATGHQLVAGIAWDQMTPMARQQAIDLLRAAPRDACLLDLFPTDSRPLEARQRELFMRASTWSDIVRPRKNDKRPCTRFHRGAWHFINYFWSGISGETGSNQPKDRTDIDIPTDNAVERLTFLRPFVACRTTPCGVSKDGQATALAWILHLVGDLQQPLHTSARVTTRPDEQNGDQGGGLFKLGSPSTTDPPLSLHGYWDGIIDAALPRQPSETEPAYLTRVAASIVMKHQKAQMEGRMKSGDFTAWSHEGLDTTKKDVYPSTLKREAMPASAYRTLALAVAEEAIALGAIGWPIC